MALLKKVKPLINWRWLGRQTANAPDSAQLLVIQQLQRWAMQRTLIWAKPVFDSVYYQSMVLGVDWPRGVFSMDALFPFKLSPSLLVQQEFLFEIREHGCHSCFMARCEQVGLKAGVISAKPDAPLLVKMPKFIEVRQRRRDFRVDVSHLDDASCRLAGLQREAQSEVFPIVNISASGAALLLPTSMEDCVTKLKRMMATISVLDVMFEVAVSVRRVVSQENGQLMVGVEFVDLSPTQMQKLTKWTVKLQRQLKKESLSV